MTGETIKPIGSAEQVARGGYTVRQLLDEMIRNCQDLDMEVAVSFANSDGMQIAGLEIDSETEQMKLLISAG